MISVQLIRLSSLPSLEALRARSDTLPFGNTEAQRRRKLSPNAFLNSMGAWLALHTLLAQRSLPLPLTVARNAYGKPYFENTSLPPFNLSHTDGLAAAILGDRDSGSVGIDVQIQKPVRSAGAVVSRFFSAEEQAKWEHSDRSDDVFFKLWTQKEARAKLVGETLLSETPLRTTVHTRTFRLSFDGSVAYLTVAAEHPLDEIEILSDKEIQYEAVSLGN